MRLLAPSATITLPPASIAGERGQLKAAAAPAPSAHAAVPEPASVVTTPARVTRRTRWATWSTKATTSFDEMAMPLIPFVNVAAVPTPLALPDAPLPASDVATPASVTTRMR
jgi:hypothetical protein